jgi:hypothetical protein
MTDPTDDTDRHPIPDPTGASGVPDAPPATTSQPPPAAEPPLRADPDRPADSGWREPAWFPPRDPARGRDRRSNTVAIVIGLVLIGIGAWYFLDRTLGIAMPRISWSSVWPIILIVIGGLILVRSFQRKA